MNQDRYVLFRSETIRARHTLLLTSISGLLWMLVFVLEIAPINPLEHRQELMKIQ